MADVQSKTKKESGSSNTPLAEKGVITKQPKLTQPQQKETKYSVGFFPVLELPSLDNNSHMNIDLGMDNRFFAQLVKPPVECESTFQVGSSNAAGSTTVKIEEEKTEWQQGFFEGWKTEPKVLATTAVCPEMTQYNISRQVSPAKKGNKLDLRYEIVRKVLLIATLITFVSFYPKDSLMIIAGLFGGLYCFFCLGCYIQFYCYYINKAIDFRTQISERFKIKDFNCSFLCCSCNCLKVVFCERCHLCQLHSELEYQKQHGGPEAIVFYI